MACRARSCCRSCSAPLSRQRSRAAAAWHSLSSRRRHFRTRILDLIVHIPDLPLYDNTDKVGFGLWRHVAVSFPLELAVLLIGAWFYARALPPAGRRGHIALRSFVVLLALLQVYANFGPPPASETAMAIMALGLYVALAAVAALVECLTCFRLAPRPPPCRTPPYRPRRRDRGCAALARPALSRWP